MTKTTHRNSMTPLVEPESELEADEYDRYSRHILLEEIGVLGQRRLKDARVLVIGAGGLGSSALLYLAAAGVGTLGIIDDDHVETSNLQRQVIHGAGDVRRLKVESARDSIAALNPRVRVETYPFRLTPADARELFEQYDLVIDGTDNFTTRYLVSDAAEITGKPCVWGSILRFEAQVSVFWSAHGPTYRDLFPDSPPPESAPLCGEAGVFGMLCGVAGSMMAAEALKLITGTGRSLLGRLATFDLKEASWRELHVVRDPERHVAARLADEPDICDPKVVADYHDDSITVSELEHLLRERSAGRSEFELVDVREEDEWAAGRIPESRLVPLSRLRRNASIDGASFERPIVLYCKAGPRARAAQSILGAVGYTAVTVVRGGFDEWAQRLLRQAG